MTLELLISSMVGLFAALIGAAVIAIGWKVAHRQESERDRATKRRDMRIQYLLDVYRQLEHVSNRPITEKEAPGLERGIADIQLLGTPHQVKLAQEFATGIALKGSHPLDPLLIDLRQSLREELNLEPVPPKIEFLRFSFAGAREFEASP
jgi:hypothetical protein